MYCVQIKARWWRVVECVTDRGAAERLAMRLARLSDRPCRVCDPYNGDAVEDMPVLSRHEPPPAAPDFRWQEDGF